VQRFPSLHVRLSLASGFEQTPVAGSHVPAKWHWSDAVQTTVAPPTQVPDASHLSTVVQALLSLQILFNATGFEHNPFAGLQVPGLWHWSGAAHTTAEAPTHVPDASHLSTVVQALLSLQVLFNATGFEHTPFAGLQVPALWHWSEAVHTTAVIPKHTPEASHLSMVVQALLSLQVLFAATGFEQSPLAGLHVPTSWHWSDAVQTTAVVPMHVPEASHLSIAVQALPSLQVLFSATGFEHVPLAGLHVPTSWH